MEDIFDTTDDMFTSPLDDMNIEPSSSILDDDILGSNLGKTGMSPFDSGFDAEHPMPTYDQLRNAGFSDYLANQITHGLTHSYSQRELFHCLYESDDPVSAYNEMMDAKAQDAIAKTDKLISDIERELL